MAVLFDDRYGQTHYDDEDDDDETDDEGIHDALIRMITPMTKFVEEYTRNSKAERQKKEIWTEMLPAMTEVMQAYVHHTEQRRHIDATCTMILNTLFDDARFQLACTLIFSWVSTMAFLSTACLLKYILF